MQKKTYRKYKRNKSRYDKEFQYKKEEPAIEIRQIDKVINHIVSISNNKKRPAVSGVNYLMMLGYVFGGWMMMKTATIRPGYRVIRPAPDKQIGLLPKIQSPPNAPLLTFHF